MHPFGGLPCSSGLFLVQCTKSPAEGGSWAEIQLEFSAHKAMSLQGTIHPKGHNFLFFLFYLFYFQKFQCIPKHKQLYNEPSGTHLGVFF